MREITVIFDPERKLILYTAIFVLAVGVGPFGTYEVMTFWERVMFWAMDVFGVMAIAIAFVHVAAASSVLSFIPIFFRILLGAFIGAFPAAGYVTFLFGAISSTSEILTPYPNLVFEITVFSSTLLLTEFVVWPAIFGHNAEAAKSATAERVATKAFKEEIPAEGPSLTNRFFERLPLEHQDSKIVSISMQDHYAEVTTTRGVTSLLMRLSDIEDLLQTYPGCRIHRSHWASSEYAESISKRGRGHELRLTDGRTLAVSDKFLSDAKRLLDNG